MNGHPPWRIKKVPATLTMTWPVVISDRSPIHRLAPSRNRIVEVRGRWLRLPQSLRRIPRLAEGVSSLQSDILKVRTSKKALDDPWESQSTPACSFFNRNAMAERLTSRVGTLCGVLAALPGRIEFPMQNMMNTIDIRDGNNQTKTHSQTCS